MRPKQTMDRLGMLHQQIHLRIFLTTITFLFEYVISNGSLLSAVVMLQCYHSVQLVGMLSNSHFFWGIPCSSYTAKLWCTATERQFTPYTYIKIRTHMCIHTHTHTHTTTILEWQMHTVTQIQEGQGSPLERKTISNFCWSVVVQFSCSVMMNGIQVLN